MVNYQQGKIYKIECNETGLIYIGSTSEPTLARRLTKHVQGYKEYKAGKGKYMSSYIILENGNYDIYLIENCPCNSKDELHQREGYHVKNNDCVNKNIPCRTRVEYYEANKERFSKLGKEYYMENKDKKIEYQRQYSKNNKDFILEQKKEYYIKNKDRIIEKQKEKVTCVCGSIHRKSDTKQHQKRKIHIDFINSQTINLN
jgi:hypothetical protein